MSWFCTFVDAVMRKCSAPVCSAARKSDLPILLADDGKQTCPLYRFICASTFFSSPRSDCSGWQSKSPTAQLTSGRKERGEDGNEEHKRIIQSGTGVLRIAKKVANASEVVHSNMFKMKKKGVLRQSSSVAEQCVIINTA